MSPRPKKALNMSDILKTAAQIADQNGMEGVTLASLAKKLGIRPPSLFNHFDGVPGLRRNLSIYALDKLFNNLLQAVEATSADEAVISLSRAYLAFARHHPGIYEATLSAPDPADREVQLAGKRIVDLVVEIFQIYRLEGEAALHAVRGFRSMLHGFTSLEQKGGFGLSLHLDDSFERLIKTFLSGIQEMKK